MCSKNQKHHEPIIQPPIHFTQHHNKGIRLCSIRSTRRHGSKLSVQYFPFPLLLLLLLLLLLVFILLLFTVVLPLLLIFVVLADILITIYPFYKLQYNCNTTFQCITQKENALSRWSATLLFNTFRDARVAESVG